METSNLHAQRPAHGGLIGPVHRGGVCTEQLGGNHGVGIVKTYEIRVHIGKGVHKHGQIQRDQNLADDGSVLISIGKDTVRIRQVTAGLHTPGGVLDLFQLRLRGAYQSQNGIQGGEFIVAVVRIDSLPFLRDQIHMLDVMALPFADLQLAADGIGVVQIIGQRAPGAAVSEGGHVGKNRAADNFHLVHHGGCVGVDLLHRVFGIGVDLLCQNLLNAKVKNDTENQRDHQQQDVPPKLLTVVLAP